MTVENEGQLNVPPESKPPEVTTETIPDKEPEVVDHAKVAESLAHEKKELVDKLQKVEEERTALEKRVKDNQEYISRTRNVDKAEKPSKTFEEYEAEVLKEFENEPKAGFKRILRDMAYDRDLERREFEKRIKDAEDNAFKRAISLDPEKGKVLKQVQALENERPDLGNLTFDQKMEFVGLLKQKEPPKNMTQERVSRDQEMLSDVGGGASTGRHDRMPSWVNDPEVLREAKGRFKSKQEMMDWANPEKAKLMGQQMRQQA